MWVVVCLQLLLDISSDFWKFDKRRVNVRWIFLKHSNFHKNWFSLSLSLCCYIYLYLNYVCWTVSISKLYLKKIAFASTYSLKEFSDNQYILGKSLKSQSIPPLTQSSIFTSAHYSYDCTWNNILNMNHHILKYKMTCHLM